MSIISEKLEDIRNYLDVEVHPVVSPDRWDVYSVLCDMVDDIITLLKAQEPRVMTLQEVLATEVVYAEDIDKTEIIPVLVDRRAHDRVVLVMARLRGGPSLTIYPLISEYGKRWRCWTSRPTDEQREATPWE
jgi:hypothetical protein